MNSLRRHPAVPLAIAGQEALIDEELVPLVREIWRAGIRTMFSCQDAGDMQRNPRLRGWIFLQFCTPTDAIRFLNRAAPPTSLERDRCMGQWEYGAAPIDRACADNDWGASADLDLAIRICFPKTDLAWVTARLQRCDAP